MKFEKVSLKQYLADVKDDHKYVNTDPTPVYLVNEEDAEGIYNDIQLPTRATKFSAGYDFRAPYDFTLRPGQTIKLATGIRVLLDEDKFLLCAPRSGHGFKARIQLDNTVGIIDADYANSSNEGHIMLKLTNDSHNNKVITVNKGAGMIQAIIMRYFTVGDDNATNQRDGGFGSTDKEEKHE